MDIRKLEAKITDIDVNGEKIKVESLTMPELIDFMKISESKDIKKATHFLVFSVLRKNIPIKNEDTNEGMLDDEIHYFIDNKLTSKAILKILTEVRKVSGLGEDDTSEKNEEGNDK